MGNPQNYSIELPQRCMRLLTELWGPSGNVYEPGMESLGPLRSTFLLSMSMPILGMPIERLERPGADGSIPYLSDIDVNKSVSASVIKLLRNERLDACPFFQPEIWHYCYRDAESISGLSSELPNDVADQLKTSAAANDAAGLAAIRWVGILRNALAHGGVLYLDRQGRSTYMTSVNAYAFVSGAYTYESTTRKLVGLHFLAIDEASYFEFLKRWVSWLSSLR